jgi:hypothetical protein
VDKEGEAQLAVEEEAGDQPPELELGDDLGPDEHQAVGTEQPEIGGQRHDHRAREQVLGKHRQLPPPSLDIGTHSLASLSTVLLASLQLDAVRASISLASADVSQCQISVPKN